MRGEGEDGPGRELYVCVWEEATDLSPLAIGV